MADPELERECAEAEQVFVDFHSDESRLGDLRRHWEALQKAASDEERARLVTMIWLPEIDVGEETIVGRWRLSGVEPNPEPVRPSEVAIQLNALYTLAESVPEGLPAELESAWRELRRDPGAKIADYDHPVALFETGKAHELITCLDELDGDVAFEKERGVLPEEHRVTVVISVSVTHAKLDSLAGRWVEHLLRGREYGHLSCLVLSEEKVGRIKRDCLGRDIPVYSVTGKYGVHFTALKYTQLLLEKGHGIRAGFKLDTDEGIRSRDLFDATGRTWFQTMCHDYWGGTARDHKGRDVLLGVNEGEYVNWRDIRELGYPNAMRTPDVRAPESYRGAEIFFNKAFAHGMTTELYNRFDKLADFISHPVVKGGGYGITNEGLRKAVPFTYSKVGRAEDQQFYFSCLAGGCRGIFHPDLRIAHYKGEGGAVAKAEEKTVASRFVGDMYRLVIFGAIAARLGVKEEIDPMPGVFAGGLARCQALLAMLYRAYAFLSQGRPEVGRVIVDEGIPALRQLKDEIDRGEVERGLEEERRQWREFIRVVDGLDPGQVGGCLDGMVC